jgi:thymidylate synthase
MKHPLIVTILCILPIVALADKGQSIMFGDSDPIYQEKLKDTAADEQAEHCKQLRAQMDELKYRPLRRNAIVERYKLECQPDNSRPAAGGLQ